MHIHISSRVCQVTVCPHLQGIFVKNFDVFIVKERLNSTTKLQGTCPVLPDVKVYNPRALVVFSLVQSKIRSRTSRPSSSSTSFPGSLSPASPLPQGTRLLRCPFVCSLRSLRTQRDFKMAVRINGTIYWTWMAKITWLFLFQLNQPIVSIVLLSSALTQQRISSVFSILSGSLLNQRRKAGIVSYIFRAYKIAGSLKELQRIIMIAGYTTKT